MFDETASTLDNGTEETVMQSVNALHGKKAMIIIVYRFTMIEGCDVVYCAGKEKLVQENNADRERSMAIEKSHE